jgi:hypothetical protein
MVGPELGFQVVSGLGGARVESPVAWTVRPAPEIPFVADVLTLRVARQLAAARPRRPRPRVGGGKLRPGLRAADAWEELVPAVASLVGPLHAFSEPSVPARAERFILELADWHRWIWRFSRDDGPGQELLRIQLVPGLAVEQSPLRFARGLEPFPGMNGWPEDLDWPALAFLASGNEGGESARRKS